MKIIIVGAGEVGYHIANRLARENKDVVVIDKDPEATRRVSDNIDVQTITGLGSNPVVLEEAGLREAEILLAVTNSDEINLVACLAANIISPTTRKIARIRDAGFDRYHEIFREKAPHIDTIINPEIEVVKTIDRLMSVPGASDVVDFAEGRVRFVGISLDRDNPLIGVRLSELSLKTGDFHLLIPAVVRDEKLIVPRGNDVLMAGDLVYFISEGNRLAATLGIFNKQLEKVKRVLIVGGGRIGLRLAKVLEQKSIGVKIIERNATRCEELAEQLDRAVVLQGDGSDQTLLLEENITDVDVFVTLTDNEETNILTSLLAKRLGARKTITKISKFGYFPLMSAIGIEQVVSPRLSAINSILQHTRRGKVLSAISIKGEQAEVIEAVALETSDVVGKPLRKISFPKGALLISIIRGEEVIIPSGESVVEPNDHIVIFAGSHAIPKIEKILAVKLEYF